MLKTNIQNNENNVVENIIKEKTKYFINIHIFIFVVGARPR